MTHFRQKVAYFLLQLKNYFYIWGICNHTWKFKSRHIDFWSESIGTTKYLNNLPKNEIATETDWELVQWNPLSTKGSYIVLCHNQKIRLISLLITEKIWKNQGIVSAIPPCTWYIKHTDWDLFTALNTIFKQWCLAF